MRDFDELKALALAATDTREWSFMERGSEIVFRVKSGMQAIFKLGRPHDSLNAEVRANADFIAAANPETILALIAQLEQANGDAERLDFLDTNLKWRMGWDVGLAPAGSISMFKVGNSVTPIREAIDKAIAARAAIAGKGEA